MKKICLLFFVCLFVVVFIFSSLVSADSGQSKHQPHEKYKDREILVKFKPDVSEAVKNNIHEKVGSKRIHDFPYLHLHHVKLKEGLSVEDAIRKYSADPNVEYAEPNYIVYADELIPNDTYFNELWGLHNTGQTGGTPDADISGPEAWSLTTGNSNIVVAVIDTGIDYTHEDIKANIWINMSEYNGRKRKDDDGNGYVDDIYGIDAINNDTNPMDDNGHGTHVAGTIGAVGNNGIGVTGVNWKAKVMACKFLDYDGTGTIDGAIKCFEYIRAMKAKGVNVVATNNSWGCGGSDCYSQALYDAINAQRDIISVASAGNNNTDTDTDPHYPSSYFLPNVIAVAATDHNDAKAWFSNYGRRTVHVGAPGANILSAVINNTYATKSGTSMASPHVSGIAALIKSYAMTKDWIYIRNRILSGGDAISSLNGLTVTGRRINAHKSLTCSNSPVFSALKHPFKLVIGQQETLSALSINCESPIGPVTVTLSGGEVIELLDNGISPDLAAGDGIFSASWTPSMESEYLTFSSPAGTESFSIPALSITTSILLEANIRYNYSQTLKANGGLPPYTWSIISRSLPDGLTLNSSTGEISGMPTTTGMFYFAVQVRDSQPAIATKELSIRVVDDRVVALWIKTYEEGNDNAALGITLDGSNNIYVSGWTSDSVNSHELVIKYDSLGNVLLTKTLAGGYSNGIAGNGIATDGAGNVYITDTLDNYDCHIVKLDPNGNVLWTRTYDSGATDIVTDIAADSNGNVYVTGYKYTNYYPDYLTLKYDTSGNLLWAKTYGGSNSEYAKAVAIDQSDNVYITGNSYANESDDCLAIKYDPSGNVLWAQVYSNGACEDIAIDRSGNIYLTGYSGTPGATPTDFLTIKYDPQWNLLWSRSYDSGRNDTANSIVVDSNGNTYITGNSSTGFLSSVDSLTVGYDTSGNLLWTKTFDNGADEFANGIVVDNFGDIYITGHFSNMCFTMKCRID